MNSHSGPECILGVDPGDTSGVAIVERNTGKVLALENVDKKDFNESLLRWTADHNIRHIVAEDYRIYGHKASAHKGSTIPAIQILGALKLWSQMNDIKITLQPAAVLTIARKWSKSHTGGPHSRTHYEDAYNHIFYYRVSNGLTQPKGVKDGNNRPTSTNK